MRMERIIYRCVKLHTPMSQNWSHTFQRHDKRNLYFHYFFSTPLHSTIKDPCLSTKLTVLWQNQTKSSAMQRNCASAMHFVVTQENGHSNSKSTIPGLVSERQYNKFWLYLKSELSENTVQMYVFWSFHCYLMPRPENFVNIQTHPISRQKLQYITRATVLPPQYGSTFIQIDVVGSNSHMTHDSTLDIIAILICCKENNDKHRYTTALYVCRSMAAPKGGCGISIGLGFPFGTLSRSTRNI